MKTLSRKERISMFLSDYYFGYSKLISILRIIGGPILMGMGWVIYQDQASKAMIAYSGFLVLYGGYMVLRPVLFVLFRPDGFKTELVAVELNNDFIHLKDGQSESKLRLESCKGFQERKRFFTIILGKSQRLRIPKQLLTDGEIAFLSAKSLD